MANQFIARKGLIALADSQITGSLNISQNIVAGGTVQATFDTSTATAISGAFDSVSSSLASDISLNASSISSLNAASSSYLLNTTDTFTGTLSVNGFLKADSSSTGDYVRLYGSSGTGQWDIYGNGENLRFSENSGGGGSVVVDTNLGIGGSPSSWNATSKAIQLPQYASLSHQHNASLNLMSFALETSANTFTYADTGVYPLRYNQDPNNGAHTWHVAASGTSGNTISWTTAMRINVNGNVGIGTTDNSYRLRVSGDNGAYWNGSSYTGGTPLAVTIDNRQNGGYDSVLLFQQADSGGTVKNAGGIGMVGRASWTAGNNATQISDMYFLVRNSSGGISERMRIDSNGRVGIGTAPSLSGVRLHTYNNSTDAYNIFESSANKWVFGQAGSVCQVGGLYGVHSGINVDTTGQVGIGDDAPDYRLVVSGTGTERVRIGSTNNTTAGVYFTVKSGGSLVGNGTIATQNNGDMRFFTGTNSESEKMRLLAGGGLTFNGDTAAANALDDYEEGTWTPNISSGGTWGTVGTYIKIGTLVMVTFRANPTGTQTITANSTNITNLPFTIDSGLGGAGYVGSWTDVSASSGIYGIHTTSGTTAYFTGTLTTGGIIAGTLVYRST